MLRNILPTLLVIFILLSPCIAFANTEEVPLAQFPLGNENMHLLLPTDWYMNTPSEIDEEFLIVTENSERKLKNYLSKKNVAYNILPKDLSQEINILLIHDSKTKLVFDYNVIEESKLIKQAEALISDGIHENKAGDTYYTSYNLQKINQCTFMMLEGRMEDDNGKAKIIQYSTIINGYGINISIKAYEAATNEQSEELISKIVESFNVGEVQRADIKKAVIFQLLPPILIIIAFISFTIYLFVKEVKKNKKAL